MLKGLSGPITLFFIGCSIDKQDAHQNWHPRSSASEQIVLVSIQDPVAQDQGISLDHIVVFMIQFPKG